MPKVFPINQQGFNSFSDLVGINFTKGGDGYSQCILEVNEKLLNPNKVVHGGVVYSMADTSMGAALYIGLKDDEICATIEIKINYLKAVKAGTLICDTKVLHKGKNFAVLESEVKNNDILVAKAIGTFSIFKVNRGEK
jgi:acyl-CoA thioesterase